MARIRTQLAIALACTLISVSVSAHFQILYTPDLARNRGIDTPIVLAFSHPVHGGPNMDMGLPEAFFVLSQRGEDAPVKKTDLLAYLEEITWHSEESSSIGYAGVVPRKIVRSLGDYTFVLRQHPITNQAS